MYPGYGTAGSWVGTGRGYTGTQPDLHMTIFSHILASRPYLRPNEANFKVNDEVSQIGLRTDPELTRIDPESTLLDRSPDGPQMTPDDPQIDPQTLPVIRPCRIDPYLGFIDGC